MLKSAPFWRRKKYDRLRKHSRTDRSYYSIGVESKEFGTAVPYQYNKMTYMFGSWRTDDLVLLFLVFAENFIN